MASRVAPTEQEGGIEGAIANLIPGRKASSDFNSSLRGALGSECRGRNGAAWRLVRLNLAAGMSGTNADGQADPPGRRTFKYSNNDEFDVEPTTAATDLVCGVSPKDQDVLVDNDIFYVQVEGVCELYQGDDGTDTTAGDYMGPDNDADKGKVVTVTTNFNARTAPFRALEAKNGVDQAIRAQIIGKLVG